MVWLAFNIKQNYSPEEPIDNIISPNPPSNTLLWISAMLYIIQLCISVLHKITNLVTSTLAFMCSLSFHSDTSTSFSCFYNQRFDITRNLIYLLTRLNEFQLCNDFHKSVCFHISS